MKVFSLRQLQVFIVPNFMFRVLIYFIYSLKLARISPCQEWIHSKKTTILVICTEEERDMSCMQLPSNFLNLQTKQNTTLSRMHVLQLNSRMSSKWVFPYKKFKLQSQTKFSHKPTTDKKRNGNQTANQVPEPETIKPHQNWIELEKSACNENERIRLVVTNTTTNSSSRTLVSRESSSNIFSK